MRPRALAWSRVRLHVRVQAIARSSFIKPRRFGNSVPGHTTKARRARNPLGAEALVGRFELASSRLRRVDPAAGYCPARDHQAGLERRRTRRPSAPRWTTPPKWLFKPLGPVRTCTCRHAVKLSSLGYG